MKHISLLNRSVKLSKKFYEDLLHVLNYVLEINEKYEKHKIPLIDYSKKVIVVDKE